MIKDVVTGFIAILAVSPFLAGIGYAASYHPMLLLAIMGAICLLCVCALIGMIINGKVI